MKNSKAYLKIYNFIYRIKNNISYLGFGRQCPICHHYVHMFAPAGINKRENARCIWCDSLERHRLVWLFFQRKTNLFDNQPKKMLHFAPENAFVRPLSKYLGTGYITADLYNTAMVKIDITNIQFPDDSFDVIFCSHVLEHIVDDVKAIRELSRVLLNDGWALIIVPITTKNTYEERTVITPEKRLEVFGQSDHVRRCGLDYKERLENNGFYVNEFCASDIATEEEREYYGLRDDILFFCKKKISETIILGQISI
jgi:SAM-dependent methyltransferase